MENVEFVQMMKLIIILGHAGVIQIILKVAIQLVLAALKIALIVNITRQLKKQNA